MNSLFKAAMIRWGKNELTLSQISMTSQLDESASNPLDLSEIESESKEDHS